jgi:hypothetical protein
MHSAQMPHNAPTHHSAATHHSAPTNHSAATQYRAPMQHSVAAQPPPPARVGRNQAAAPRSGTTRAAAILGYVFGAFSILGAVLMWAAADVLEASADNGLAVGEGWVSMGSLSDAIELYSLVFFLIGVAWCVFAGLLRHGTAAGWIGLLVMVLVALLGEGRGGNPFASFGFWLDLALLGLLLAPTTRIDCGIKNGSARLDREQRNLLLLQEQLRLADTHVPTAAANPYAAPPGATAPHPRAYWDPSVGTWVRWEPTAQAFLRHDPVSRAWHRMG